MQTRTITYWDDDNANNTGKNAEEAENPFTKLSRMARNDAITLDKHDITVADLLRIPFYSGNGIVTCYDLEESMKKFPQTFAGLHSKKEGIDNDYIDKGIFSSTQGIKMYGSDVTLISYKTRLSLPIDFDNVESYIIEFYAFIECQDAKSKRKLVEKMNAEFKTYGIIMEKFSEREYKLKGWKGENNQYGIEILRDTKYNGDNEFAVLVTYKEYKLLNTLLPSFKRLAEGVKKREEQAKKIREATLRRKNANGK